MKILIGSNNKDKIKQFEFLFSKYAPEIELVSLAELGIIDDVEEDADNLLDNARKKAQYYGEKSGIMTLADDTGLFVDVLGGEPGVHAKRWHEGTEHDRSLKLLERLKGVPEADRTARYIGVLTVYDPTAKTFWDYEGRCEGRITDYFSGSNGFGYDPIFRIVELDKQYAELSEEEKLTVGHRAKGVEAFVASLK